MSGYNLSGRHTLGLLKGRLGIFEKEQFQGNKDIDGVNSQYSILAARGGSLQQERMIRDKRKTLDRALWYSYQAAQVKKPGQDSDDIVRALINPNKLKQDYDDKIISIGYECNYMPGDVFEWVGTNTYWIIYLQELTETAYFRGDIRKCSFEIKWKDEDKIKSTYAAVRGPVETKINYIQKHDISMDTPNHSLNILMPKNEDTLKYFKRYAKFYLQDSDDVNTRICWRVEAIDSISMPGILEVIAVEYYANKDEDDIEEGIVGGLIKSPENPNDTMIDDDLIKGETFIRPKRKYKYQFAGTAYGEWYVDKKYPVDLYINDDDNSLELCWRSAYSGQFDLYLGYENDDLYIARKTIVVESLF